MFFGDLGGSKGAGRSNFTDLDLATVRYNVSLGLRYNLSNGMALRFDAVQGRLYGNDAYSQERDRYHRNLSFRTDITELSVSAEIISLNFAGRLSNKIHTAQLYSFVGIGLLHFNPKGYYRGTWYDLQPLGTEGQGLIPGRDFYSLNALVIPMGIGYRMNISRTTLIGVELSMRKSFTDYIDDVSGGNVDKELLLQERGEVAAAMSERNNFGDGSQRTSRGSSATNDNYAFLQFTVSQGFGRVRSKNNSGFNHLKFSHVLDCPKFK